MPNPPTKITYDADINKKSGFLEILDAPQDPNKPPASVDANPKRPAMRPQDRATLLHLLFWLCSDVKGRDFLFRWRESVAIPRGETLQSIKQALETTFNARLGPGKQAVVDALIEGHLAADRFVQARDANDAAAATAQEQIYLQQMAIVMDSLHGDVAGHEFSLNW